MLTNYISKELKIPINRVLNKCGVFTSEFTTQNVLSLGLYSTSNANFFELGVFSSPEKDPVWFSVEVHNPTDPYVTLSSYPMDLSFRYREQRNETVRILRWKNLCRGAVSDELAFKSFLPLAKDSVKNAPHLLKILTDGIVRRNSLLKDAMMVSNFNDTQVEAAYQLLTGALETLDVTTMLNVATSKDVFYFRVFVHRVDKKVYFKAHYVLVGSELKFNKTVEAALDFETVPVKTK